MFPDALVVLGLSDHPHSDSTISVLRKVAIMFFSRAQINFCCPSDARKARFICSVTACILPWMVTHTPSFLFPETEMAGSPTPGIGLAPNAELSPAPCFSALGPPPPYEETLITSWLYPELAVECIRTISKQRQPMLGKLFDLAEILGDPNLGDLRVWASTSRRKSWWKEGWYGHSNVC